MFIKQKAIPKIIRNRVTSRMNDPQIIAPTAYKVYRDKQIILNHNKNFMFLLVPLNQLGSAVVVNLSKSQRERADATKFHYYRI